MLDISFMINFWLLVYVQNTSWIYVFLTISAFLTFCLIVLFHILVLNQKFRGKFEHVIQVVDRKVTVYEAIDYVANVNDNEDIDLFKAAENRPLLRPANQAH